MGTGILRYLSIMYVDPMLLGLATCPVKTSRCNLCVRPRALSCSDTKLSMRHVTTRRVKEMWNWSGESGLRWREEMKLGECERWASVWHVNWRRVVDTGHGQLSSDYPPTLFKNYPTRVPSIRRQLPHHQSALSYSPSPHFYTHAPFRPNVSRHPRSYVPPINLPPNASTFPSSP